MILRKVWLGSPLEVVQRRFHWKVDFRFWRGSKNGVPWERPSNQVEIDWHSARHCTPTITNARVFFLLFVWQIFQKEKNPRAGRAARAEVILFFLIKYANLWRPWCLSRGHCVSSLLGRECARTYSLYSTQFEHTWVVFVNWLSRQRDFSSM